MELNRVNPMTNIAVRDLARAKRFYIETLGLRPADENSGVDESMKDDVVLLESGNGKIILYRSEFAGSNRATAMSWSVGNDLDRIVRELKEKGVRFERYGLPDMTEKDDIYSGQGVRTSWFKDPDGNILSLMN